MRATEGWEAVRGWDRKMRWSYRAGGVRELDENKVVREGEREEGGGGGTHGVHCRNLEAIVIDPRIPTMPGRSTSSFSRPGRHRVHQSRNAMTCSASRMKSDLHSTENHV